MTTETMEELVERAAALGREHGTAGGTWVFDGNTDREAYEGAILLDEQGDPAWWDRFGPASGPLSGEWADGMTLGSLYHEVTGNDPDEEDETGMALMDDLARAYEQAYSDAWRDEVLRMARYQVGES